MAADDEDPISGVTDDIKPWTLRAVPSEIRNGIIARGRERGLTAAQEVERMYRQADSETPKRPEIDLAATLQAMAAAAAAGLPVSKRTARGLVSLIDADVRAARGLPPLPPRQRRLAGPDSGQQSMLSSRESEVNTDQ